MIRLDDGIGSPRARASAVGRLAAMYLRDRLANVTLLVSALAAWAAVALLFLTRSPVGDPSVQLSGALLLGVAVALTVLPLLWLAAFARKRRIAHRGDWARAARRAMLAGFVVTLLVLLRALDTLSLPLLLFIVAMAIFVELTLTFRR